VDLLLGDEVYIFQLRDGRIIYAWGLEETTGGCGSSGWPDQPPG
jgi:hypothetical protein